MADPLDPTVTEALRAWRVQNGAGVEASAALALASSVVSTPEASKAFMNASLASQNGEGFEKLVDCLRDFCSDGERAVILCGFKSGRADECLDAVVAQRDLWFRARKEIRSGMVMPILVLFMAALVAPLPAFFAENGTIFGYLFSAAIPMAVAFGFWRVAHRMMEARKDHGATVPTAMDTWLLKIPVVKTVEQRRNVSEFSSLLSLQLSAGVTISDALDTCSRCLVNGHYRDDVARAMKRVRKGEPFSASIQAGDLWPQEFVSSLSVGEKSGRMDDQLMRYADSARESYTRAIKEFSVWLPRAVYVVISIYIVIQIASLFIRVAGIYQDALKG